MNGLDRIPEKIALYGIGNNWKIFSKFVNDSYYDVVAYMDAKKCGDILEGRVILPLEDLASIEYDKILVLPKDNSEILENIHSVKGIHEDKIVDVVRINKDYILKNIGMYKYVMLTTDVDYLNYPYECLCKRDDFCMKGFLFQDSKLIFDDENEEIDTSPITFIVRDHCYMHYKSMGLFDYLKKRYPMSKWAVVMSDMCGGKHGRLQLFGSDYIDNLKKDFKTVITYHSSEAQKYDFYYHEQVYPKYSDNIERGTGVLFVGYAKNRLGLLHETYRFLRDNGIQCKFFINGVSDEDKIENSDIVYNNELSYRDYLDKVRKCDCILEICQIGNESTYRYNEAVVYNKRFLFNDPSCLQRRYYNPKFMRFFDDVKDIDLEWLKSQNDVDYGYKGDFQPERLLGYIDELLMSR